MVHSEEELKMLVTASQEAGVLEEQEEQMIHRVFGFADLTAGQVMVPRTELVAIEASATPDQLLDLVTRSGYPRLPVYRADLDHVVGILHVTDVVRALAAGRAARSRRAGARSPDRARDPRRGRFAGGDQPARRARSHRHRRVRRHGRHGDVRVADGADRRGPRRSSGTGRIVPLPMAPPRSTD